MDYILNRPLASKQLRYVVCLSALLISLFAAAVEGEEPAATASKLPTPLETNRFSRLSAADEVAAYLARLAHSFPKARVETIGVSVQGRPLHALVISGARGRAASPSDRMTVAIVGSQHGTEAAGAESLLFVARDLLVGSLRTVLNDIDVILIPDANPDGRENFKRSNANRVNLNVDFVALSQPESRALVNVLKRYRPEVVLDVHESAVLKRKSLAKEGYLTDFVVQFEYANNPSIPPALPSFCQRDILPPLVTAVNEAGLRCHRYIGEIRSSTQPITNGGLTLKNFRNRAGIEGSLSFLVETRLDPRDGNYPTYRNIGERVRKQRIAIERFLKMVHSKRERALAALKASRPQSESVPLALDPQYVASVGHARVPINLRRISDGTLERIDFVDHRTVAVDTSLPLPRAYLVHDNHAELAKLLDRHGIQYRTLDSARSTWAVQFVPGRANQRSAAAIDRLEERHTDFRALPGDLWINVNQPRGRLAALMFEPQSSSNLFRTPPYVQFCKPGESLPVLRIPH